MNTKVDPASSAPAGNDASATAGGAAASTAVMSSDGGWANGLQDAGNRELVTQKGWDKSNSPDVVLTSYRELESRLGKSVLLPNESSTQEDYDKLYTALGKPKVAGEYSFKLHADLPAGFPYDDAFATEFKNWAFDANLTPTQAQNLHDKFTLRFAKQLGDSTAAQTAKVSAAHQAIVAKWGDENSVEYKRKVDMAGRAIRNLGLGPAYKAAGLLTANGEITDASVAFSLATIGEGLYREDNSHGSPNRLTEKNPWKPGQENVTEQGRIQRENPELAKSLISAAGLDPAKAIWQGRKQ